MSRSFALKPMPSLRAYQIPCYSHGPVHSYAFAGRLHRLRRRRLLSRGRSGTLWPEEARAARCNPAILDLSSTELIYIFFAIGSMRLLPASGLLSPPFAPARRAHPATGRPVLSPLSPGAARRRGGHRALKAGAFEHHPAEHLRAMPSARLGQKNRRLRRAERDCGRPLHGAAGAIVCGFLTELGVLFIGGGAVVGSKIVDFFYCRL